MDNISDSIEQLTASLQELTAERAQSIRVNAEPMPETLPAQELSFWTGIESFVQQNRDYAAATRSVSVGTY